MHPHMTGDLWLQGPDTHRGHLLRLSNSCFIHPGPLHKHSLVQLCLTMWWDKLRCTEGCRPESRWALCSPTFWCDSEHSVWWWRPVNIRGVSDRARVGSIIVQRCIYQRDGNVAASRGSLPPDTAKELTWRGEENLGGEVEKLEREKR